MKQKYFYSHLIDLTDLTLQIADLDIHADERKHLLSLMESNMHNHILEAILDELPEEDKKLFLSHIVSDDHEQIWKLLQTRIPTIEEKIKRVSKALEKELHNDLKEARDK